MLRPHLRHLHSRKSRAHSHRSRLQRHRDLLARLDRPVQVRRATTKTSSSARLMTLKAMTYLPTGGIVAAVTAGLPEQIGGERNWDYRYCWLRDTSFTLLVLLRAGYTDEADRAGACGCCAPSPATPTSSRRSTASAASASSSSGRPPGSPATRTPAPSASATPPPEQFQLDVYGEVAVALARTPEADDDIRVPATDLQAHLVDHLCDIWHLPDEGIWEVRGGAPALRLQQGHGLGRARPRHQAPSEHSTAPATSSAGARTATSSTPRSARKASTNASTPSPKATVPPTSTPPAFASRSSASFRPTIRASSAPSTPSRSTS